MQPSLWHEQLQSGLNQFCFFFERASANERAPRPPQTKRHPLASPPSATSGAGAGSGSGCSPAPASGAPPAASSPPPSPTPPLSPLFFLSRLLLAQEPMRQRISLGQRAPCSLGGCSIEFSEGGRGRSAERRAFRPGSPWVGTLQLPTTCAGGYSLPCLAISRIPFCFLCYSGAWLFVNRLSPCSNYHRRWLSNVETPNTPSAAKVAPRSDRQSLAGRRSAMRQRASRCTARQCDSEPASQPLH